MLVLLSGFMGVRVLSDFDGSTDFDSVSSIVGLSGEDPSGTGLSGDEDDVSLEGSGFFTVLWNASVFFDGPGDNGSTDFDSKSSIAGLSGADLSGTGLSGDEDDASLEGSGFFTALWNASVFPDESGDTGAGA